MNNPFRIGDKVILVKEGIIGWEGSDPISVYKIKEDKQYTVMSINDGDHDIDYEDPTQWDMKLYDVSGYFHPDHFKLYKPSNEERIAKRMEELRAT